MKSIIIPSYNEEKRIGKTLEKLALALKNKKGFEVVIVDESTDSTPEIIASFKKKLPIKYIHYSYKLGKGGALRKGFAAAKGDCLIMDADLSVSIDESLTLFDYLKQFDVAIGSRYIRGASKELPFSRWFASRNFNFLVKSLLGLNYSDTQCGYKAFTRKVAKMIAKESIENGFVWDVECLLLCKKHGFSVKEVPVNWKHISGGVPDANYFKTGRKMFSELISLRKRF
ncbi:glycosyltransferase family 2 protein [Candidatus Micrarchaeota archaeon]|nr:glycosyltransferase family 2 protein [Candidatus Micrarchaeota archaeon]